MTQISGAKCEAYLHGNEPHPLPSGIQLYWRDISKVCKSRFISMPYRCDILQMLSMLCHQSQLRCFDINLFTRLRPLIFLELLAIFNHVTVRFLNPIQPHTAPYYMEEPCQGREQCPSGFPSGRHECVGAADLLLSEAFHESRKTRKFGESNIICCNGKACRTVSALLSLNEV